MFRRIKSAVPMQLMQGSSMLQVPWVKPVRSMDLAIHNPVQVRSIYSVEALSMHKYVVERQRREKQYPGQQVTEFFDNIRKGLEEVQNGKGIVFQQDLQNAVHLCSDDKDQLALLDKMISIYHSQQSNTKFGRFSMGAVIMRLYYYLNLPHSALEMLNSPNSRLVFNDTASFKIALCLLYKNEMYQDVLDLLDRVIKERLSGQNHPMNCITVGFAAILKLNTEEGYAKGLQMIDSILKGKGSAKGMHRRLLTLTGAVAVKAKRPDIALTLLKNNPWPSFPTIRNLQILCWCQVREVSEALSILRNITNSRANKNNGVYKHIWDTVVQSVAESRVPELKEELRIVQKGLTDGDFFESWNLFEVVLSPIMEVENTKKDFEVQDRVKFQRSMHKVDNRSNRRVLSLMDTMEG